MSAWAGEELTHPCGQARVQAQRLSPGAAAPTRANVHRQLPWPAPPGASGENQGLTLELLVHPGRTQMAPQREPQGPCGGALGTAEGCTAWPLAHVVGSAFP